MYHVIMRISYIKNRNIGFWRAFPDCRKIQRRRKKKKLEIKEKRADKQKKQWNKISDMDEKIVDGVTAESLPLLLRNNYKTIMNNYENLRFKWLL